jgi:hypothetical protein
MGAVFAHGIRTGVYEFVRSGLGQLQDKGLVPLSDVQIQVRTENHLSAYTAPNSGCVPHTRRYREHRHCRPTPPVCFSGKGVGLASQGLASGVGTLLGTCVRIPHEVLKQRLQCGQYTNVNAALMGTLKSEGVPGLFRGSFATLGREVPCPLEPSIIASHARCRSPCR